MTTGAEVLQFFMMCGAAGACAVMPMVQAAPMSVDACTRQASETVPPYIWQYDGKAPLVCNGEAEHRRWRYIGTKDKGFTVWRYCQSADRTYHPQFGAAAWTFLSANPELASDVIESHLFGSPTASEIAQKWTLRLPHIASVESASIWCDHWPQILAGRPAATPPPPQWITSGATLYKRAGKSLGMYAGQVKRGVACDCAAPIIAGLVTYCAVPTAAPDTVAACKAP